MEVADKAEIWFAVLNIYAASKRAESYWCKAEKTLKDMCRDAWKWQKENPRGYDE